MTETNLAVVQKGALVFSDEETELIRKTFGPNLTDQEFQLFLYTSKAVGLNPLRRQIYAVKRNQWNSETRQMEQRLTIQTGIDGFRAVSFRNGRTLPGKEPTFTFQGEKTPANPTAIYSATAYLKVYGNDNQYHEVSATAYWDEYVPLKKDGTPQAMWAKMPRTMLAKCAEALLHRKCNPEELTGIYTGDEMAQADVITEAEVIDIKPPKPLPVPGNEAKTIAVSNETISTQNTVDIDALIDTDVKAIQEVFPGTTVKKVTKKGKYGFLDEVGKLKTQLRQLSGNDEEYYNILGCIGPGTYASSKEIDVRKEQVAFWKALKAAVDAHTTAVEGKDNE